MKTDPKVLKAAYKSIFSGEMGKIVMKDFLTWCCVDRTSFDPTNPHVSSFNEGKRFLYLRICQMAKIDLDKFMNKEAGSDTR